MKQCNLVKVLWLDEKATVERKRLSRKSRETGLAVSLSRSIKSFRFGKEQPDAIVIAACALDAKLERVLSAAKERGIETLVFAPEGSAQNFKILAQTHPVLVCPVDQMGLFAGLIVSNLTQLESGTLRGLFQPGIRSAATFDCPIGDQGAIASLRPLLGTAKGVFVVAEFHEDTQTERQHAAIIPLFDASHEDADVPFETVLDARVAEGCVRMGLLTIG